MGEVEGAGKEGSKQTHEKNGSRNENTFREGVNNSRCDRPPATGQLIGSNAFLDLPSTTIELNETTYLLYFPKARSDSRRYSPTTET